MKKHEKILEFLSSPLVVGEVVTARGIGYDKKKGVSVKIVKLVPLTVKNVEYGFKEELHIISESDVVSRNTRNIGANPFSSYSSKVRFTNFSLSSILHSIGFDRKSKELKYENFGTFTVAETNWCPYVIVDGKKQYYQRDFVWSLTEKQLLIESIYNGIDCGKVIIRKHSWKHVENKVKQGDLEIAFKDIVDGKQRLNCLIEFVQDKFCDLHGNYYSDLSDNAQYKFNEYMGFSYGELDESCTDFDVCMTFLTINHAGVHQSVEHIEFVKSLMNKLENK